MKKHISRLSLIFMLLALLGFILLISNITSLENLNIQLMSTFYKIQNTIHSAFKHSEKSLPLNINHTTCEHFAQEPTAEEVKEERDLLNSITWPGPLVNGLPVELSSDPAKSYFVIQGPPVQHIGDQLVVNVHMHNFLDQPKTHGGDFLIARLHSPELGAGVAGKVHDHQNGNYTVLFPLLWIGVVHVEITMVHPSEAVEVLKRLQKEQPDRVFFKSMFRSGNISEATVCNLCMPLNEKPLCNYTDLKTGEPWYCYKPQNLSCETRIDHSIGGYKKNLITEYEAQFFQSKVNIKVSIPASMLGNVTVLPAKKEQTKIKRSIYHAAGYYFNNTWKPLNGAVMQQFSNSLAITRCLKGKTVYMFGDSTIRQWFEYLTAFVPNLKQINIYSSKQLGPFMAVDSKSNILVTFRGHGPPIRSTSVFASGLRYVANELDRLRGGPHTVVLVSVWAHFSTFPTEVYIRRLWHIRKAVLRLLDREPATVVVIRSANLQKMGSESSLFNSDWFSVQIDAVLRAMFRGIRVQLLDAWEMTLAHHLPHDIHPSHPIIKNMIDLILSQICLKKKK
ncbi:NXPE family member 3 precursor [Silurus meridionalis]|nr:NXPE family member 3 precursor [Silurus meridionalis]